MLTGLTREELRFEWELDAAKRWRDPTIIRGKGVSQAQSRIDQLAY